MITPSFWVGWMILIISWVAPQFIKDKRNKHFTGAVLAAIATGIFLCDFINRLTKH